MNEIEFSGVSPLVDHRPVGIDDQLIRGRLREIEAARARQRLAGLLARKQLWSWLAEFAGRQADKADTLLQPPAARPEPPVIRLRPMVPRPRRGD